MGVTGRECTAAYVRTSAWRTPSSVLYQIPITSADGIDANVQLVTDAAFNQDYLMEGEVGDQMPLSPELGGKLRYEHFDTWLAAALGSPTNPTGVSSQGAATSLVAYSHVVNLAPEVWPMFTLAVDNSQYVTEVPSFKVRGFTIRNGDNGSMEVSFQTVGNKANYDSTTNTNSTVGAALANSFANRVLRKNGTFRMNVQSAGALAGANANSLVKEVAIGVSRPLADSDHCFGNDDVAEPEDDGFAEFTLELTYARMNTVSANSLATALKVGRVFKADMDFLGPYINSATQREIKFEWPCLQLAPGGFKAQPVEHSQVKPTATFVACMAASSPTGMAFVNPLRMTIVNMNSQNLLV